MLLRFFYLVSFMRFLKDLPSPKGKLITGHLSGFKKSNKHQVIEGWVQEVGDLFTISLMGKQFLVSSNLDFNTEVLKSRPNSFTRFNKIKEVMDEMGFEGVFSAEGERWKIHRKITAEALSLKNVKAYFPIIRQMTERLLVRWKDGGTVDVQKEMMLYTVDITTNIAFGHDSNTLGSTGDVIQDHLKKIFPMINKRMASPFPLWRYYKTEKDKELDHALEALHDQVQDYVNLAKVALKSDSTLKEQPANFLQALLVEQEKEGSFSDNDIFGNVFTMLLAGEDTTSNSISWAIFYLAQHPDVVAEIKKEVAPLVNSEGIIDTVEKLERLVYTEQVANETLRIKPTTPTLMMTAIEDVVINSVQLPKGTNVLMQTKVAQTDQANFGCPNDFKPERWASSGCPVHGNHKPEAIKIFGGGVRFCPGKALAIYEMKMAIAMICYNYDFGFKYSPEEVNEVAAFTMYPENLIMDLKYR